MTWKATTMLKLGIGGCLLLLSLPALSATCESLVEHHINTELQASALFPNKINTFVVILCQRGSTPIYDKFFALIHASGQHKYNAPTGGLSRAKPVLNPNGNTRTTGVVVSSLNKPQEYTVQTRTRLPNGKAIDIAKTLSLAKKEFKVFVEQGITVGIVRL